MDRIGFGNLIPSFDAQEKKKKTKEGHTYNENSNRKMKNTREKHEQKL